MNLLPNIPKIDNYQIDRKSFFFFTNLRRNLREATKTRNKKERNSVEKEYKQKEEQEVREIIRIGQLHGYMVLIFNGS